MTRASLAVAAALLLVPAPASAAGGSCNKPILWKLGAKQRQGVNKPVLSERTELRHGPVVLTSYGTPQAFGPHLVAATAGSWRICSLNGRTPDEGRWSVPGTFGGTTDTSFAMRRLLGDESTSISVAYARRTWGFGGCGMPQVAYYTARNGAVGDPGAALAVDLAEPAFQDATATWSLADGNARVCRAGGFSAYGKPWSVGQGGPTGSHAMHEDASGSAHYDPVMYFWVAFTY